MEWYSNHVRLDSPSTVECENVMRELKYQKEQNKIKHSSIYLHHSSDESTSLILSQVHQTGVGRLQIYDTMSRNRNTISGHDAEFVF